MENIVYQGKSYTQSGFAKLFGVSSTTVSKYLKENNNDAEMVAKQLMSKKQYKYKGNIYASDNKLSEATGINRRTLKRLIKEIIHTEERIIEVDKIVENYYNTQKTYKYKDETYKTVKEAAEAIELDQATLSKYLKLANYDMGKAMELFYEEHTYYTDNDNGIKYTTQQDLADALGVNVNTLRKYIEDNGSVEKAVQAIRSNTRKEYTWKDKKYHSLESLSKAMEISRPTLKRILEDEANGNVDKAYKIYIERNKGKYQGYEYKDIEYGSIKKVLKAYGLTQQNYYQKIKEDDKKEFKQIIDELIEEKREKERVEREREEKAAKKQKEKEQRKSEKENKQYIYKKTVYNTIVAVSKASGMDRNKINRLVKKYGNNIDIALQKEEASKTTYTYDKKTFDSIKSLAEYTEKNELRLGRYIRKYNRDAEKAIFMMNLRDNRIKKIHDSQISLQDTAIILGIKYSELCTYLNSGMTIEEIKKNITPKITMNLNKHSATIMYDKSTSLAQYCIDNGLNYSCIYYAITEYGKTPKEAIEHYKKNGQQIPKKWIFERYGVLLKHLLLSENISSKRVIDVMRKEGVPLNEAIEHCIIKDYSKERDLDTDWQQEIYYFFTMDNFSKEDKESFIKEFYVTKEELDCVAEIKSKIDIIERKKLLFEFAECIKNKVFPQEELADLMYLYDITNDEIDIIYLELYTRFKSGVLLTEEEPELIKINKKNDYIRNWENMTDEEKAVVKQEMPEEYEDIIKVFNEICSCKNSLSALRYEKEVKNRMRKCVYTNVGENMETRRDLETEPTKLPYITIVQK